MGEGGRRKNSLSDYSNPISVGGGGQNEDCGNLSFTTNLMSPQQPALSKAQPGDVFKIKLSSSKTPQVYNFDDEVCGSIICLRTLELVACLEKGKAFKAAILSVAGDVCTISVDPAN